MKAEAISTWDVVNNQLFAQLAAEATLKPIQPGSPFSLRWTFIPEKNHALLLQAFSSISQWRHESLLLVGHGPLEHQIAMRAGSCRVPMQSRWHLLWSSRSLLLLRQSHTRKLASRKDTWALVVNEAMAAGLPVIVVMPVVVVVTL